MKILWLSHVVPYPPKGGVLQRSYNLVRELSKYHEVHLLSFVQSRQINTHFENFQDGLKVCHDELSKFCRTVVFVDIPCERYSLGQSALAAWSLFSRQSYTVNWLKSKEFEKSLLSAIDKESFDLVHFDTISLAPYVRHCSSLTSLDHHNVESHMMKRRAMKESNLFKKVYFYIEALKLERYESSICADFDVNILCSDLDKERLFHICGDLPSLVVENGVDTEYFSSNLVRGKSDSELTKFLFVGRLSAYTNSAAVFELVSEIWPTIISRFPNARLDIVGPGASQKLIKYCESNPSICLHGYVDDVRTYFDSADIYICPMRDGGGTKLKILDALAMGIPVVATRLACEGISVEDGKSVLFAESANEFVAAATKLIDSRDLMSSMSSASKELIESKYSFRAIGMKLNEDLSDFYYKSLS